MSERVHLIASSFVVMQVELTTHLACNGHGLCDNTTMSCRCEGDFIQGDCSERRCPSGPAWFDEPSAPDVAHASAECSNAGTCERDTGQCICYPGFRGAACAELDCPRDKTGRACSGNGRCLSAWRLAELADANGDAANFSYGVASRLQNTDTAAWDRNVMHGCACDAADTPATGARGPAAGLRVSGVLVENPRIGGYGGYDCSRRTCPRGDDPRTPGEPEVQTLRCNETTSNFTLTFRQQTTAPIDGKKATVAVLEAALEALSTIADVRISAPAHVPSDRYGDDDAVAATRAPGDRPACNETGVPLRVTFFSEMGDLPMLSASPTMNVSETVKVAAIIMRHTHAHTHTRLTTLTPHTDCSVVFFTKRVTFENALDDAANQGHDRRCDLREPRRVRHERWALSLP